MEGIQTEVWATGYQTTDLCILWFSDPRLRCWLANLKAERSASRGDQCQYFTWKLTKLKYKSRITYLKVSRKQVIESAMESQSSESLLHFICLVYLTFYMFISLSWVYHQFLVDRFSLMLMGRFISNKQKNIFIKDFDFSVKDFGSVAGGHFANLWIGEVSDITWLMFAFHSFFHVLKQTSQATGKSTDLVICQTRGS